MSPLQYLPLAGPSFALLAALLVGVLLLVQFGAFQYAFTRLGLSPWSAFVLLAGSLAGSYFNIPVAQFDGAHVETAREIDFYGMRYIVPALIEKPGVVLAVNVGGAIIPGLTSLYLMATHRLWLRGMVAIAVVSVVCYMLSTPVYGLGIAEPVFAPSLAAAVVAFLLARESAAPLAYVSGSLGALIGADILNLDVIPHLGAPIASIGGAGTFDGIFLIGIVAVLIASLPASLRPAKADQ